MYVHMSEQNTHHQTCIHRLTKSVPSGAVFELSLTFHGEDTATEVLEVDPPTRVGVQTFGQLLHLWEGTEKT